MAIQPQAPYGNVELGTLRTLPIENARRKSYPGRGKPEYTSLSYCEALVGLIYPLLGRWFFRSPGR